MTYRPEPQQGVAHCLSLLVFYFFVVSPSVIDRWFVLCGLFSTLGSWEDAHAAAACYRSQEMYYSVIVYIGEDSDEDDQEAPFRWVPCRSSKFLQVPHDFPATKSSGRTELLPRFVTISNSNLYSPDSFGNEGGKAAPLSKNKRAFAVGLAGSPPPPARLPSSGGGSEGERGSVRKAKWRLGKL